MKVLLFPQQAIDITQNVKLFSDFWWQSSGVTFLLTLVLFVLCLKFIQTEKEKERWAKILAIIILSSGLLMAPTHALMGQWHISYGLPLQLCNISTFVIFAAFMIRKQALWEVAYYFGLTGGLNALISPQFTQGTSTFFLIDFYISHAILLLCPLYIVYIMNVKLRQWSWLKALGWLNVTAWSVAVINWFIGANYMFMCNAPTADSPFIFTNEWPWYIIGFEVVGVLFMFMLYLPSYLANRQNVPVSEEVLSPIRTT